MKDTYIYPAILHYADDGISILFPDLPGCLPCADTTEEAVANAKEAMGLHLWGMEKDGDFIPEPTAIPSLTLEQGEIPLLVEVYMPPIRHRHNTRVVKKTLTIPAYMNASAEAAGINFSQVLQEALAAKLHIPSNQV